MRPPDSGWAPSDSMPLPEVVQKESDSAWELWNQVSEQHEARFANTEPAPAGIGQPPEETGWANTAPAGEHLKGGPPPRVQVQTQPAVCLEAALKIARRNSRVCPRPKKWEQLVAMLPARKTLRGTEQPPPAIAGPAWYATPERAKRLCFREHLEWAERVALLQQVMDFMEAIPEEEWLHAGDK